MTQLSGTQPREQMSERGRDAGLQNRVGAGEG